MAILVLDQNGKPVKDARVNLYSLASDLHSSSRYFHSKEFKTIATDWKGWARFDIPKQYADEDGKSGDWPVTAANFHVTGDGFSKAKLTVKTGKPVVHCCLVPPSIVSPEITLNGKTLKRDKVYIKSYIQSSHHSVRNEDWVENSQSGRIENSIIKAGQGKIQAAHSDESGWRYFSDVISFKSQRGGNSTFEMPLRKGKPFSGGIDNVVSRPVKKGVVRILVVPKSEIIKFDKFRSDRIVWRDWQAVKEDGSFHFNGLPEGKAWIAVACEGWVSAEPVVWIVPPVKLSG